MKAIITVLLLPTLLCGCRLYTVTQGEGVVYTDNSNFLCVNNSGDCVQHYDSPTTETLQALPSPDYAFTRWEGCHYDSLTSCEAEISQRAVDEDMEWTITAVFEKKRPDIEPAQYTYNALGQRITKTVGGVTTVFQYDLDGKLIAELDANGHPLRQHAYLDGSPIAMIERKTAESDPEVYYVHTDHLATPDLITNDQGRIVADFEKSPFGVPYVNYSEIEYHLGFPGQYYDAESGLHYNYYRNYDANTGRYVQSDPIGLAGGINLYSYAFQNPTSVLDPFGLNGTVYGYGGGPYSNYYTNRNNSALLTRQASAKAAACLADGLTILTPFSGPLAPWVGGGASAMTIFAMLLDPPSNGTGGALSLTAELVGKTAAKKVQAPLKLADWGTSAVGGAAATPLAISNIANRVSE